MVLLHVTSQYDVMTSGEVTVWCHDVMWRHIMNLCVSQSRTKKEDFWAKDCTICETREVRECSGDFIPNYSRIVVILSDMLYLCTQKDQCLALSTLKRSLSTLIFRDNLWPINIVCGNFSLLQVECRAQFWMSKCFVGSEHFPWPWPLTSMFICVRGCSDAVIYVFLVIILVTCSVTFTCGLDIWPWCAYVIAEVAVTVLLTCGSYLNQTPSIRHLHSSDHGLNRYVPSEQHENFKHKRISEDQTWYTYPKVFIRGAVRLGSTQRIIHL